MIGGVAGGAVASVFGYLKWKKGRTIEKIENSGSNNVIVHIHGDGNTLNLAKDVYRLAENSQVLSAIDAALGPVTNKEAKRIEFRQDDRPLTVLDENDVKAIEASVSTGPR